MKPETTVALVNATMWIAVSAAIIATLIITGRVSTLWFFLIPMFGGMYTKHRPDDKDGE